MKSAVILLCFVLLSQSVRAAKPNYSYHVKIDDPQEANFQEKAETRLLENAQGFYSVLEPNGALRTVTYTADEEGFKPVVTYSYGHPVKQQVVKKVVAAPAPAPVAVPVRQQVFVQQPQPQPQFVQQVQKVQKVQQVQFQAQPLRQVVVQPQPVRQQIVAQVQPQPLRQVFVQQQQPQQYYQSAPVAVPVSAPVKQVVSGGYSYGTSSADAYGLSYGTPGFTFSASRKFAPVQYQVQRQVLPAPVPAPVQYQTQYPVVQRQVVHQQTHVVQSPQVALQPQPLVLPEIRQALPLAQSQPLPKIVYGAPTFQSQYRAPEIKAQVPTFAYAPQHVQYAPAQEVRPVQLSAPQIQLSQLAQAQINYVPQQAAAPLVTQVRVNPIQQQQVYQQQIYQPQQVQQQVFAAAPAPAPVQVAVRQPVQVQVPLVQKQVLSTPVATLGNGLRITGNALAVPAPDGKKNPLTFAYSYGSGSSSVSHSYSGSGW